MDYITNLFRRLHEQTGVNITVLYDPFDIDRFFNGIVVTIELFLISAVVSVAIGLVGAGFLILPADLREWSSNCLRAASNASRTAT
jgi:hypothetical protein